MDFIISLSNNKVKQRLLWNSSEFGTDFCSLLLKTNFSFFYHYLINNSEFFLSVQWPELISIISENQLRNEYIGVDKTIDSFRIKYLNS